MLHKKTHRNMSLLARAAVIAAIAIVGAATPAAGLPASAPAETPGRVPQCGVRDVDVALGDSEGTAGTRYHALVFTNNGRRTCTVQGFPGVSFVAGDDGHQVGAPAASVGTAGPAVTLAPRGTAAAPLGVVNPDNFDPADCLVVPVRGLRVYPPNERKAEFLPWATRACSGPIPESQLKIGTVHPGSGLT
ncbi:DUF4232 domain-containing protein [Actinophytocola xanthii]|uniref:DUF4232 domain-containing protein n=1 Tax=Actinophytocola xanthii TaxID=1912961 RepID=A0A1Q8CXR8_9PSEU|nr:DUF4232 domain-containing protein [Actinophytocola xanthii]OLF19147.1 hypothetical protein BU204_01890 [Actinophytocola xanthii]